MAAADTIFVVSPQRVIKHQTLFNLIFFLSVWGAMIKRNEITMRLLK